MECNKLWPNSKHTVSSNNNNNKNFQFVVTGSDSRIMIYWELIYVYFQISKFVTFQLY